MKKNWTVLLLAVLAVFVLAACDVTLSKTITITNNGSSDYCELYTSVAGTGEWSENQLAEAEGEVVTPGNEKDLSVGESGDYDVLVVTCDGLEQVLTVSVP